MVGHTLKLQGTGLKCVNRLRSEIKNAGTERMRRMQRMREPRAERSLHRTIETLLGSWMDTKGERVHGARLRE